MTPQNQTVESWVSPLGCTLGIHLLQCALIPEATSTKVSAPLVTTYVRNYSWLVFTITVRWRVEYRMISVPALDAEKGQGENKTNITNIPKQTQTNEHNS